MEFKLRPFRSEFWPRPRQNHDFLGLAKGYKALDLEIGCGVGMHSIQRAMQHPDRFLVAIERTQNKFEGFEARLKNHPNLPNLLPIRDDAVAVVSHLIPDSSLDKLFLMYPNPYPKESQANKRWHRNPFVACMHQKLKPGGRLHLATNMPFYAVEAKSWLQGLGLFRLEHEMIFEQKDLGSPRLPRARTHFEKKYLSAGQSVVDLTFVPFF